MAVQKTGAAAGCMGRLEELFLLKQLVQGLSFTGCVVAT